MKKFVFVLVITLVAIGVFSNSKLGFGFEYEDNIDRQINAYQSLISNNRTEEKQLQGAVAGLMNLKTVIQKEIDDKKKKEEDKKKKGFLSKLTNKK